MDETRAEKHPITHLGHRIVDVIYKTIRVGLALNVVHFEPLLKDGSPEVRKVATKLRNDSLDYLAEFTDSGFNRGA